MDLEKSREYIRDYMQKYRKTEKGKAIVKKANATYYQKNKVNKEKVNDEGSKVD